MDICDGREGNGELIRIGLVTIETDGRGEGGTSWADEGGEDGVGVRQESIPGDHDGMVQYGYRASKRSDDVLVSTGLAGAGGSGPVNCEKRQSALKCI